MVPYGLNLVVQEEKNWVNKNYLRRWEGNEIFDEEVQGMKTDINSLTHKILAIKVSFKLLNCI